MFPYKRLKPCLEFNSDATITGNFHMHLLNTDNTFHFTDGCNIIGNIRANEIFVEHGLIVGNLSAIRIHLSKFAQVKGKLTCCELMIDKDCDFEGEIKVMSVEDYVEMILDTRGKLR